MIGWTATVLTLIGGVFVAKKSRWGYIIWIASNLLWLWVQAGIGQWGMVVCMVFNTGISIWGFIEWSKKPPVILGTVSDIGHTIATCEFKEKKCTI